MTDNAHGGRIVNPNEGDGSTSDPNWQGDIGDQGNDIRLAEEQALINEQAGRADGNASGTADDGAEGNYTSSEPAGESGGYTSSQSSAEEGEYTDKDKPLVDAPQGEGDYTDRDR